MPTQYFVALAFALLLITGTPVASAAPMSPAECEAVGGTCNRNIFSSNCVGNETEVGQCNTGAKSCCKVVTDPSGATLTGQVAVNQFNAEMDGGNYTNKLDAVPVSQQSGQGMLSSTTIVKSSNSAPTSTTWGDYQLLEGIPGQSSNRSDLPSYVKSILNAGLILIVLSAVFMVTVGGFLYLTSAGNTSKADTAKSIIQDSLVGLGLAMLAYLILYVINPDLVNLRLSQLSATSTVPSQATPPSSVPTGGVPAVGCPVGVPCTACSGCEAVTGVDHKSCGGTPCQLNTALLAKIRNIQGVSGWRITEAWPPTVTHLSSCHQNGTCADLNNSGGPIDPATIKKYYDAFQGAGLSVLYESKNCAAYTAAGITNCKAYPTMTNQSSFHVQ